MTPKTHLVMLASSAGIWIAGVLWWLSTASEAAIPLSFFISLGVLLAISNATTAKRMLLSVAYSAITFPPVAFFTMLFYNRPLVIDGVDVAFNFAIGLVGFGTIFAVIGGIALLLATLVFKE